MGVVLQGIFWFGLYLSVVALPLLLAALLRSDGHSAGAPVLASLGMAAGLLAFSLMIFEFGLVARIKAASRPFGTDALMYFHRLMGLAALGFLLAHPFLLLLAGLPGSTLNPLAGDLTDGSAALAFWLALLLVVLALIRRRLPLSYETWQKLHLGLAVAVAGAALLHFLPGLLARGETWLAALLATYALTFAAMLADYRLLRPWRLAQRPWQIVANRDEGGSTHTLVLQPVNHAGMEFAPGQFAWVSSGGTPFGFRQHPVTIASSAEQPARLEFSVKALGDWSAQEVPNLAPGRHVFVDGPYGGFSIDHFPAEGFLLVGGGIGITPMRSALLTLRDRGDQRPLLLVHAAHDPGRALFLQELDLLQQELRLKVVRVYESVPPGTAAETGYVTAEVLRRHLPAGRARWQCFLCGPGPMMTMVEQALLELGVPAAHIHTERFDMV